jgi:hypothetical protein
MAERHVRDGRVIVSRQRLLIERRQELGEGTEASRELLVDFERPLAIFERDLKRLHALASAPVAES